MLVTRITLWNHQHLLQFLMSVKAANGHFMTDRCFVSGTTQTRERFLDSLMHLLLKVSYHNHFYPGLQWSSLEISRKQHI